MNETGEQKIVQLKKIFSTLGNIDRTQLASLFQKEGFEDVTEKAVDQIFDQLDEEDSGYISSDQILTIIKSLEEASQEVSEMDDVKVDTDDTNDDIIDHMNASQTFSSSPPNLSEFEHQKMNSMPASADINLFSTIDPFHSG